MTTQDVMLDEELPNMGQVPLGIVSAGTYSTAATRPANQVFLNAWRNGLWRQSDSRFHVGRRLGWNGRDFRRDQGRPRASSTATQAMKILANWKDPDSPRGPIAIDPATRDIVENVYIRRVEKRERQARQCRVRHYSQRQRPVERGQPAKVNQGDPALAARPSPRRHRPPGRSLGMDAALSAVISIAFHGLAFAMVLYLVSVGLSVTMGLMGFVNLAHGVFAAAGGYVMTTLMNRLRRAVSARARRSAPIVVGAVSVVLERLLYRPLYGGDELDQVLLTIGLVFMSVAVAKFFWGPLAQPFQPPPALSGQIDLGFRDLPDLSQLPHRRRRGAGDGAVARAGAHAVRRADPRRGRQSAHGAVGRHQHLAPLHLDLRAGQRARRAGRRRSAPRSWRSIPAMRSSISSIS